MENEKHMIMIRRGVRKSGAAVGGIHRNTRTEGSGGRERLGIKANFERNWYSLLLSLSPHQSLLIITNDKI